MRNQAAQRRELRGSIRVDSDVYLVIY
jgi:hypothetical protein